MKIKKLFSKSLSLVLALVLCVPMFALPSVAVAAPDFPEYTWSQIVPTTGFDPGTGDGQFKNNVYGVAIGPDGNLYTTDYAGKRVEVFTPEGAFVKSIATPTGFPKGIAFDNAGDMYIAYDGTKIEKIDPATGAVLQTFSNPTAYFLTVSVASDGTVYATDNIRSGVYVFAADGTPQTSILTTGTYVAPKQSAVAVGSNGNLFIAAAEQNAAWEVTPDGTFVKEIGGTPGTGHQDGTPSGILYGPRGITTDAEGYIYVADTNANRIQVFNEDGTFAYTWGTDGIEVGQFGTPNGICVDDEGNIYVADIRPLGFTGESRIQKCLAATAANEYTVTFEANGGTPVPAPQTVAPGGKVTEPATPPTKAGNTFGGWYKDPACTIPWDFANDTVSGDTTIYAKWTPVAQYTVTFEANGGTPVPAPQTVAPGGKVTEPATPPTKAGNTFGGWYKDPACTIPWDFANDTVSGDTTIYAKWTPVAQYTVTFVTNGGSPKPANQSVATGGKVTKPANPTKANSVFAGWYKDAALTQPWNFSTDTVSGNITLYARWVEIVRDAGLNREQTAVIAAQRNFPDGAKTVIVSYALNFPDALAASSLAGAADAPILLTDVNNMTPATRAAIVALHPTTIYITGGTGVVSKAIENDMKTIAPTVKRLGGLAREETAKLIANETIAKGGSTTEAFLATSLDFPDALAVAPIAAQTKIPILLTPPTEYNSFAKSFFAERKTKRVTILGGTGPIPASIANQVKATVPTVDRYAGVNRYATNKDIIDKSVVRFTLTPKVFGVATGQLFPDALCAGASIGHAKGVVVLTDKDTLVPEARSVLQTYKAQASRIEIFGGTGAIAPATEAAIRSIFTF